MDTSGSVGGLAGNRWVYPEANAEERFFESVKFSGICFPLRRAAEFVVGHYKFLRRHPCEILAPLLPLCKMVGPVELAEFRQEVSKDKIAIVGLYRQSVVPGIFEVAVNVV